MAIGIEVADFALDGYADLAALVTYDSQGSVSVFTGLGGGVLSGVANYPTGIVPWDIGVADVDRDLLPDVILGTLDENQGVRVLSAAGDGTLLPYVPYDLGYDVWGLAVGDVDGDFLPDLVVASVPDFKALVVLNQLFP